MRRHQHSSCTFARNLVIFGGYSEYGDVEKDLHVLDMNSWMWKMPEVQGEAPTPRMAHTATRFGHDMIVYGGYSMPETATEGNTHPANKYLSDVHVLDTKNWAWSTPKVVGPIPNALCR